MAEGTRSPLAPYGWKGPLYFFAVGGLLASLAAGFLMDLERRLALLALLLAGFGLAGTASSRNVPLEEAVLGGRGYQPPKSRATRILHTSLSLAFNGGVAVVVFAALVRFQVIPLDLPAWLLQVFPVFLGVYLLVLALAVRQRIEETGGVLRSWYTRVHGWFLFAIAVPILLAAIVLLFQPSFEVGGAFTVTEPDLQVLVLVGILGVGTQLFLAVHLPTTFDLVGDVIRRVTKPEEGRRGTPPFVYALLLSLGITIVLGFVFLRVGSSGGFDLGDKTGGFLLAIVPVALVIFMVVAGLQLWRESRRGLFAQKMTRKTRNDLLVFGFSILAGTGLAIVLVMNLLGRIDHIGPFEGGRNLSKDLILLTILVATGPPGFHLARQSRKVDALESRLPDFLNDLAQTRRAGLTLAASLHSCSLSDYGALTPEIRKMANQVSWGIGFTDALSQFAGRVPTKLVQRAVHLIIEAAKTGGSVADILKAAAKDAYEIKALEQERRGEMSTYVVVLYVVFFVFLVVIAVMDSQFIPQVIDANNAANALGAENSPLGGNSLDHGALQFVFFNAAIVQALGNGIVSGVLSEGRYSAGFRHVSIMALTGWVLFRFLLA